MTDDARMAGRGHTGQAWRRARAAVLGGDYGPTREQLQADLAECRARAKQLRSQLRAAQRHPKAEQEHP